MQAFGAQLPPRRSSRPAAGWHSTVLLGLWAVFAGGMAAADQDHLVRSWQIEDGLPDASITAIQQTPDGYLWLGTPKGLVRFDGAQFKLFDASSTSGPPDARITGLVADRHGVLWMASASGGLVRFEGGQFQPLDVSGQTRRLPTTGFIEESSGERGNSTRWMWGRIAELAEDREQAVWMVTAGHELHRFSSNRGLAITPTNGLPAGEIDGLCSDRDGAVWLATGNALYSWQEGQWVSHPNARALGGPLPRLARAGEGGVWVASPRGSWVTGGGLVRRFKDGQWFGGLEPTPWTPNSLRSQVTAMIEDRSGRIWLGTRWGGVFCSDASGRWQSVRSQGSFSQCVIACLFEDRQGAVWVGTVGEGLHRITRRPVTILTLPPPANESIITASCAARDGSEWVGTDGAGAFRYLQGSFSPYGATEGLASPHVCSIMEDRLTNLWFGTWGGLFQFDKGRFTRPEGPPELGLAVLALFEDRANNLWIGTPRGLVCRRNKEFSLHRLEEGSGDLDIRSLAEDRSGSLWVGTIGRGLFRLRGNRVERFGPDQGFPSINARSLYCDAAGTLWIGSGGAGLVRFEEERFTAYTTADGLPGDTISSILTGPNGNLWMGSDNGIFACAPELLEGYHRGRSPTLLALRLSLAEGLDSRACSGSGQPVPSQSEDGRLWYPNMRGLAVFDPRTITGGQPTPGVLIESVAVDGAELASGETGERRVPSSARRFEFHYTAPDLRSPQSLRFRHKLEGMDAGWVDAGTRRVAYYSQLPPGEYLFRVMVGGADGRWHEGPAALALRVVPRLWELRWVQVLAGVACVAGVIGALARASRRRLEQQLERLRMQQALESERRRIARDLHDDLGARLTEIVLMGELAKRGEQTPNALQTQLRGITQKVRQLVTAMEEVVWTVNPKNDSLPNLASYLSDYTERFLALAQVSCRLEVDSDLPQMPVNAQVRHNLLLAVKEALTNAARHAAADKVQLRIRVEGTALRIAIEDDGHGFDVNRPGHSGNGLPNMRNRLATLGGRAQIASEPGKGTTVTLTLQLDKTEPGK